MARAYEDMDESLPEDVSILVLRNIRFEELVFLDFVSQPGYQAPCPASLAVKLIQVAHAKSENS